MKVLTILGARPQFIKAAPVCHELRVRGHREILVHTGQHYDWRLSEVFFQEMEIPPPAVNLEVGSGQHGWQTGTMLIGIEQVILEHEPDCVLVYGDTNSTLAGALAACKLRVPLAHVEAGLRSYNRSMPEEHNRVLADHCADLLLCPTQGAVANLAREALVGGVHEVGDTMLDALLRFLPKAEQQSRILDELGLVPRSYFVATVHRAATTDDPETLAATIALLRGLQHPVVLPLHPRTRQRLEQLGLPTSGDETLRIIEPLGYFDMMMLLKNSRLLLTDSGGLQKEAYMIGVPCATLRSETEWVETVDAGWNCVTGIDSSKVEQAVRQFEANAPPRPALFGDGNAASRIVTLLESAEWRGAAR
jgi:UDP-GlcNAc3NAcA epimerase